MVPLVAGGLIAGLGSLAGSIFGTERTANKNMELAKYQYSKDLEMWNKQNEYNTPTAQMGRFKDAGLNPNLIYGQGNPGNAVQIPKYQAPTVNYDYSRTVPNYLDTLSTFQDIKNKQSQNDIMQQQIQGLVLDNIYKSDTLPNRKSLLSANLTGTNAKNFSIAITNDVNQELWRNGTLKGLGEAKLNQIKQSIAQSVQSVIESTARTKNVSESFGKYQADAESAKYDMGIKKIESEFMNKGGIRGMKDILPTIMDLVKMWIGGRK